jgi:hypothetical protein
LDGLTQQEASVRIGPIQVSRVSKASDYPIPAPSNGSNAPPNIEQSLLNQGMGWQLPFPPGHPLYPYFGYGAEPRQFDYQTGANITVRPRSGRISFDTLRAFTTTWDVARMCIAHRINSIRSFDWAIVPADGEEGDSDIDLALQTGRKAIEKPDGRLPYKRWLAKALNSRLRYDALTLYKRRDMLGRVMALEVIDGTTIAPMLDYYGRLPVGDAPAYLQFANGVPWDWMADRDVIYAPYFPQEDSPYGWAPVEDVIAVANIDERMTLHLLEYWNTSNLPAGWLEAPESWDDPAKLDDFQSRLNAKLMGDQQKKVQAHVVPQGTKFTPIRSESFDTDAYLWGFRKGCAAFGVVPSDLGVTLDINKATGETQIDVQSRIADRPMCEDLDDLITSYLQDDLGLPVKMQTSYSAEKEDRVADANVWKIGTEGGAVGVDEWRSEMFGLEVDSDRPVPRFIMSSRAGPIPLANLFAIAGPINPATGGPLDTTPLVDTGKEPFEAAAGVAPGKTLNTPGALVSTFNPDEPQFPQDELAATPAPTTIAAVAKSETEGITSETGLVGYDEFRATHPELDDDEDDEDDRVAIQKELGRWRDFARNRVKTGKPIRPFVSTVIPADVSEHITKALVGCASRAQVDAAFAEAAKSANPFSRANPTAAVAYPGSVAVRKAKHPTDALLDQIVGHYAPLVGQALASALPSQSRLAQGNLTPADLDLSQLQSVLTTAATDAWVGGALIAAATVPAKVTKAGPTNLSANQQGSLPPSMADTDWGAWTPGWAGAAATISDPGLDAVLSGLGFTLKGLASSTIDQIGSQIAQGVASGASMDSIAMGLRDYVGGDASRAFTIADTECARAAQDASMQTYQANGIEMLDWLVAVDPCDDCQANADGGPYATADFPDLPAHPRCRCASSPNIEALTGGTADQSEPVSDEGDE